MPTPITILTATTRPEATEQFWSSWVETATRKDLLSVVVVVNGPEWRIAKEKLPGRELPRQKVIREKEYLGTVSGFARAAEATNLGEIEACFHDDLQILERGWDDALRDIFASSRVGLAGFGGASGVGVAGMYDKPFDPLTLARHGFVSNMRDAESHGERLETPCQVAVLDGFSLCFNGDVTAPHYVSAYGAFQSLEDLGVVHHAYDVAVGAMMRQSGRETWFVPVSCHHAGGQTAVADSGYAEWAKSQCPAGDHGLWWHAHQAVWKEFSDVLPFGV